MKKGSLGLIIVIVIGYIILGKMQPDFQEVANIREENGLIALVFFTGPDTYVYKEDAPHYMYIELTDKEFVWWRLKYRYIVRYIPCTLNGQHRTWDPDHHDWGESLDGIVEIDDIR